MDLIQIKNLNFSYPTKKDTLKNINLKVKKGSFTCVVGENGSGKSTLLKCILGLNKGYTGEIKKETHIGYLPQKSEIQSNFPATIEEVVLSGTISNYCFWSNFSVIYLNTMCYNFSNNTFEDR